MVKRYIFGSFGNDPECFESKEDAEGEWVRYDDHSDLLRRVKDVRRLIISELGRVTREDFDRRLPEGKDAT